jgi:hypothetical protein
MKVDSQIYDYITNWMEEEVQEDPRQDGRINSITVMKIMNTRDTRIAFHRDVSVYL